MEWFNKLSKPAKGAVLAGGIVVGYILYRRFKSAQSASSSTSGTATTGCPSGYADDGSGNCVPISGGASASGGGYGGGGGGTGSDLGQQILTALQGLSTQVASGQTAAASQQTATASTGSVQSSSAATGTTPISAVTALSAATPVSRNKTTFPSDLFNVSHLVGGTTYYGIKSGTTQAQVSSLEKQGYKIQQGSKISNQLTGGALYAYK